MEEYFLGASLVFVAQCSGERNLFCLVEDEDEDEGSGGGGG